MKARLVLSVIDEDMIEITTKTKTGSVMLWGVVHKDFIEGEDIELDFKAEGCLKIEIKAI